MFFQMQGRILSLPERGATWKYPSYQETILDFDRQLLCVFLDLSLGHLGLYLQAVCLPQSCICAPNPYELGCLKYICVIYLKVIVVLNDPVGL